jgi:hypothetical protein
VPPHQAAQFTVSELAALRIVADQMKRHGTCALCLDAIAAMAGTCRTIVRYALRKANALRLVIVFERRRAGQKSLTNIVRGLCRAWLAWVGLRKTSTTIEIFSKHAAPALVESSGKRLSEVEVAKIWATLAAKYSRRGEGGENEAPAQGRA